MADKKGPEKKFRAGTVTATVWKNTRKGQDGKEYDIHNVNVERSYKEGESWKTTSSFRLQDLPKVGLVSAEAYRYLMMSGVKAEDVVVD